MTSPTTPAAVRPDSGLTGQTVVVIGGSRRCPQRCSATASTPAATSSATVPIGRVVGPADIAALALHLMVNTAVTGATFYIDGGQQLVA